MRGHAHEAEEAGRRASVTEDEAEDEEPLPKRTRERRDGLYHKGREREGKVFTKKGRGTAFKNKGAEGQSLSLRMRPRMDCLYHSGRGREGRALTTGGG